MILANLDKHLADAGYKRVFPGLDPQRYVLPGDTEDYGSGARQVQEDRRREDTPPRITDGRRNRGPLHSYLRVDRSVIESQPTPISDDQHCRGCRTPLQSDDFGGVCFGCYQEDWGRTL